MKMAEALALVVVAAIVMPETILIWFRKLLAQKYDNSANRTKVGRFSRLTLHLETYILSRWWRVSFIEGRDRLTYSYALGVTLVRLGNFMSSEIVGRVTDQTWGVRFRGSGTDDYYRPTTRRSRSGHGDLRLSKVAVLTALGATQRKEERPCCCTARPPVASSGKLNCLPRTAYSAS